MRRITLLLIILLSLSLHGFFNEFGENPADLGDREWGDLVLPFFNSDFGFTNNSLGVGDLGMFEKGHHLTDSEINTITSENLNFSWNCRFNLLKFGYQNWELSSNLYILGFVGDFDKEFLKLAFEGNESADYEINTNAMESTYLYQFTKTSFDWAYPGELNLSSTPIIVITDKDSGEFMLGLESVLNYIRETDYYLGARLSWLSNSGYAEVLESRQHVISSADSLYASNYTELVYNDPDEVEPMSGNSFGMGLGMKMKLPNGWFHFSLDDIGTTLSYGNLVTNSYTNSHLDYLNLIDEDHEAISEEEEVEEEEYDGERKVKLSTSLLMGVDYYVGKGFNVMAKYENCKYKFDGFFLGTTYRPVNWLPLQLTLGSGDVDTYSFKFGFEHESFELLMGFMSYDGLFGGAHGYGTDLGVKFKF